MININKYIGNEDKYKYIVYHSPVKLLVKFFFHQQYYFFIGLIDFFLKVMITFNIG